MSPGLKRNDGGRPTWHRRASWAAHLFKACFQQHHRDLIPLFRRFIATDAVVLDVGGHAGQFAKLFARLAPKGHVYTVEPGSYALSILRPAIAINRLKNVTILPLGLSDAPGSAELQMPIKRRGSLGFGLSHIADDNDPAPRPAFRERIPLTTVDRLVAEHGLQRLDFIKIDVEGFEHRVIAGAGEALARFRPVLFVEVRRSFLARAGDTPEGLFAHLAKCGYAGFVHSRDANQLAPVAGMERGDVFFLPETQSAGRETA